LADVAAVVAVGGTHIRAIGLAVALVAIGGLVCAPASSATPSASSPFAGTALWIAQVPAQDTPLQLAGEAAKAGVHTLFVKAADGVTPEAQFSRALVSGLRSAGVSVCGWTFAYGQDPLAEAAAAVAAVRSGAQCLVIDAEEQYDGLYGAAQVFVRALRSRLGSGFSIGLASQAEVLEHPTFPYSVFLGPGGFNFDLPQIYWLDFGVSVDAAYAATMGSNSIYGRPILPVGQLYGTPTPAELARFRALASAYGAPGMSFFDLDAAQPDALASLVPPPVRLARRSITAPVLRAGADGDAVVWAQELLNAAGARLPVGGFLGAQTARALARFQVSHGLPPSGVLTPATWKALLRLHPREPSWAKSPPDSAR
jgi:Putative peptidoglycan binding domain